MNGHDDELKTVAILALQSPVVAGSHEQWQRVAELFAMRLQHPVAVVHSAVGEDGFDAFQSAIEWYSEQGFRRFVVMPIGLESFDLQALYSTVVWMRSVGIGVQIHVARSWTTKDWVDAFIPAVLDVAAKNSSHLERVSFDLPSSLLLLSYGDASRPDVGLELASLAYHFQQADANLDVRFAFLENRNPSLTKVLNGMDSIGIQNMVLLAWRMDSTQIANSIVEIGLLHGTELSKEYDGFAWAWNRLSYEQPKPFSPLEHSGWLHVAMGIYLDALASRSTERYFATRQSQSDTNRPYTLDCQIQHGLMELDREVDSMLPSEYQGRTEEVEPQSMGTASIQSDQFGEVAWDEIWTSFCDLAMAGGPPHRGRLLEAITEEQASRNLPAYNEVVREVRRGIEMVTGLQTAPADVLGWVGVVCDNEKMAAWLMRAIIVENVMVRREGAVLFLPASPDFKVKKEIKNVITSVAKTVHYWRAHLRTV